MIKHRKRIVEEDLWDTEDHCYYRCAMCFYTLWERTIPIAAKQKRRLKHDPCIDIDTEVFVTAINLLELRMDIWCLQMRTLNYDQSTWEHSCWQLVKESFCGQQGPCNAVRYDGNYFEAHDRWWTFLECSPYHAGCNTINQLQQLMQSSLIYAIWIQASSLNLCTRLNPRPEGLKTVLHISEWSEFPLLCIVKKARGE